MKRLDEAAILHADARYELTLFIAGTTPQSAAALNNIVALCEERIPGRYDLSVIDVYVHPARAKEHQIVVIPTLLRKRPQPARRLVGDLSDLSVVLRGLDLPEAETP